MDPYKILNVPKNFTLEQLREQYKKIALQVHPDKGGSNELFQLVTQCYKKLLKHQERRIERDFMELKNEFKQFNMENQGQGIHADLAEQMRMQQQQRPSERTGRPATSVGHAHAPGASAAASAASATAFTDPADVFNRVFEENRMEDAYAAGYGSAMAQSSASREDISIPNTMRNFKISKFNKSFENQPIENNQTAVTVYKQPEPTLLAKKIAFSELGLTSVDDFSGTNDTAKRLNYTDYMKAHSTSRLIDPRTVKNRPQFKSVGELETYRENTQLTEEEQQEYSAYQDRLKEAEIKRMRSVQEQDRAYEQHFSRVSQRMLEGMRR